MGWCHRKRLATESFNQELFDEILLRASVDPSQPSWNRGGWKSTEDLLSWPSPAMRQLVSLVREAFDEIKLSQQLRAWAIVNRNGSSHTRHTHHGELTGIYYVTSGSGETIFEVPNGLERVTPEAGLLVIVPSTMPHWVETCLGGSPRVTIGFEAS